VRGLLKGQSTNFAIDSEISHGIYDTQEGRHGLGLLANLGLVSYEFDSMMFEVVLHLLAIDVVDVLVGDGKTSSPFLVAVGEVLVVDIEDSINEGEIVLDLLVTLNVETGMTS
jgi:hypothetical protein